MNKLQEVAQALYREDNKQFFGKMFNDLAGKSGKLNPEEEVNFCVASATATPLSIAYANESITALGKK